MKNRRIGVLTLAMILIGMGALMLAAMFTEINAYKIIYYIWPISLLSLGFEIIIRTMRSDNVIKIDFAAFILIFFVLFGSAGFFVANDIGVIDRLRREVSTEWEYAQFDIEPIIIGEDAEKVVLSLNAENIKIFSSDNQAITGTVGFGMPHEKGKAIEAPKNLVSIHSSNKVIYITVSGQNIDSSISDIKLEIPSGVEVYAEGGTYISAFVSDFEKPFTIVDFREIILHGTNDKSVGYEEYMNEVSLEKRANLSGKIDDDTQIRIKRFYELNIVD